MHTHTKSLKVTNVAKRCAHMYCICIYVYVPIYIHVYIYIYIHTHIYSMYLFCVRTSMPDISIMCKLSEAPDMAKRVCTCMYVCIMHHTCMHSHIHTSSCQCGHTIHCMYVGSLCVYMCVCIYIYILHIIYTHTYIDTHTHTQNKNNYAGFYCCKSC
jgi:hypothetical protein